jgi:hypothetical protein
MQRYDIQMNPLPKAPACAETMGIQGEGITSVTILDASTVKIITKRGMAVGDKEKILPPELRRMLGAAFKLATKTLGRRRMRRQVPEDMGEDITYDPDSTVDKESRPDITPERENSKEQEIKRTFHGGKLVLEPEDITTFDSFPEDLPSKHPKEVQLKETSATLRKLEATFCLKMKKAGLEIGHTIENDHIRIHRYRPSIVVWDLTNAGKKGKKCDKFTLSDLDFIRDPKIESNVEKFEQGLSKLTYPQALRWVEIIIQDAKNRKSDKPDLTKSYDRGVDVAPAGFKTITVNTGHVSIEVGHDNFTIKNLDDKYNEETCIPRSKGGKKSIPQLYRWVKDNQSKIRTMSFPDLMAALMKEGIEFHQFCAMD